MMRQAPEVLAARRVAVALQALADAERELREAEIALALVVGTRRVMPTGPTEDPVGPVGHDERWPTPRNSPGIG